jgi:excisionase family DNA binding protein
VTATPRRARGPARATAPGHASRGRLRSLEVGANHERPPKQAAPEDLLRTPELAVFRHHAETVPSFVRVRSASHRACDVCATSRSERPQNANNELAGLVNPSGLNLWARRDSNPLPPASEFPSSDADLLADSGKSSKQLPIMSPCKSNASQRFAPNWPSRGTDEVQRRVSGSPRQHDGSSLLTAREVASRLRICTATVYRLCEAGQLGYVRVSNAVRVPSASLAVYIQNARPLKVPKVNS